MTTRTAIVFLLLFCGCGEELQQAMKNRKNELAFQKHQVTPGGSAVSGDLEISQIVIRRDGDRIGITANYRNLSLGKSITPACFITDGRDENGDRVFSGNVPIPDGQDYRNLSVELKPGESAVATFYVRPKNKNAKTATLRIISGTAHENSRPLWMLTFQIPDAD